MLPLVAYYRVSTQKQGRSGLGLEASARPSRRSPSLKASPLPPNTPTSRLARVPMRSADGRSWRAR